MRLRSWIVASALSLAVATPALADITVLSGPSPGALDLVTFSDSLVDFVIEGLVGPDSTPVSVTGSETLVLNGQAIEADTGTFNFLLFTLTDPGTSFTAAQFNLNAASSGPVSIFAYDQFGDGFGGIFSLAELGDNFFNVTAANGQIIRSIVIVSTAALDDISDVSLGGITTAVVPEPAVWAMMIAGFGGVGVSMRAKRRLKAA